MIFNKSPPLLMCFKATDFASFLWVPNSDISTRSASEQAVTEADCHDWSRLSCPYDTETDPGWNTPYSNALLEYRRNKSKKQEEKNFNSANKVTKKKSLIHFKLRVIWFKLF